MRVRILDAPAELRLAGHIWRAQTAPLAAFEVRASSGGHTVQAEGTVENGLLSGVLHSGGETIPVQARVGRLLEGDDVLLGVMPGASLTPGQDMTFESLDPFTLQPVPAHARCVREERLWVLGEAVPTRVVEVAVGRGTVTAWLDPGGAVVQAETPFGLTLRRLGHKEVLAPPPPPTLPTCSRRSGLSLPAAGRSAAHTGWSPASPASQWPTSRRTTPRPWPPAAPCWPSPRRCPAPPPHRAGTPYHPGDLASALGCNALVQCDNVAIRGQAARIVGAERDVWARALLINAWVNANLEKKAVLSVPSALDVLASREGDCTEHTVLFTALARAAGVPTRMAAGLVWSEELQAFGYHAWPEVFAGRWTWTDPTLGQAIADATHIKLATGGIEDWRGVVAFLGRIRVEVVKIE